MTSTPSAASGPHSAPALDAVQRRAEQRGWYTYEWAAQVFTTSLITVLIGPYLSGMACSAAGAPDTAACTAGSYSVTLLGFPLHPNALYPAVSTIAILIQIALLPAVGSLVDHSRHKKTWLLGLTTTGSILVAALYFAGSSYQLTAVLFLLANVVYGAAMVVYNAFLPEIATANERDRVSATGWALGYLGGAVLLSAHLLLVLLHDSLGVSQGHAVRIAMVSVGLWWTGFAVLALKPLRNRFGELAARYRRPPVRASALQLVHTVKDLRRYPLTLLFVLAFLLFNDGIQAAIRYAAPYATQDLRLSQGVLMGTILMIQFVAFPGALLIGRLARAIGTKNAILSTLVVWCGLVTFGYLLPAGAPLLFVALGFGIALVLGGTQSLARSVFSQLIPHGREAEYFGLYQISEKGSTFLGSLAVTIAVSATGSYRLAIFSLVAFFIVGGLLLWRIDLRRAIRAVGNEVPDRI